MESPGFYDGFFAPSGSRDQLHFAVEDFWGPSDHEDVLDGSIGIPAVLYNDWPDIHLGTQDDSLETVDATQMRRSVVTIAATAYYLATVMPDGVARLAPLVVSEAQARLAGERQRAFGLIADAPSDAFAAQYREASNILAQWRAREQATIESLAQLGDTPAARSAIARARKHLEALYTANDADFRESAAVIAADRKQNAQQRPQTPDEQRLALLVPRRNMAIRGPVNLFRPEYGAVWLAQKTGDEDFIQKVKLTSRGQYVPFEALNFVDGKRSVLDIRDALSAEYGPMDPAEVEQYFRFLAGVGVVSLDAASRLAR
jgi:hypothetical protein